MKTLPLTLKLVVTGDFRLNGGNKLLCKKKTRLGRLKTRVFFLPRWDFEAEADVTFAVDLDAWAQAKGLEVAAK